MTASNDLAGNGTALEKTWHDRTARILELLGPAPDALLVQEQSPSSAQFLPPSQELVDWLTQLTLLYGVPFEYLVADERLLPRESLRFFFLDQNWLDRLVDGALSVATLSTAETLFNEAFFEAVYAVIHQNQQSLRSRLRNKPLSQTVSVDGTYSGLLFRSVVVSGWPGLEVQATRAGTPVAILRMDRLASDILLVLFDAVPDTVNVIEPSEGLHFGVIEDALKPGTLRVNVRGLGFSGLPAGQQVLDKQGNPVTAVTTMRQGVAQPTGVLDIATLVQNIQTALPQGALGPTAALTSGGFALQMVRGAGLQPFTASAMSARASVSTREEAGLQLDRPLEGSSYSEQESD